MPKADLIYCVGKSYTSILNEYQALIMPPQRKILAVGDSWFSLFLNKPAFTLGSNLLWHVDTPEAAVIFNLALTGNRLGDMIAQPQLRIYKDILEARYGYQYDCILFSGGGNDVLARMGEVLVAPSGPNYDYANCIDDVKVDALLSELQNDLLRWIALRDSSQANGSTPIIIHTYDYITPRNLPYEFFVISSGPWAYKSLQAAGIFDVAVQKQITDYLLERWALRLTDLQEAGADGIVIQNFHIATTLGTLAPASETWLQPKDDWHDEIHPTPQGYAKLAQQHLNPLIASTFT